MSIEYQAPTDLSGAYDPLLVQVDLSWTASVDGIPTLYGPGSYSYTVDPTSDHVTVTALGGGAGGCGGAASGENDLANSTGGSGGGGGAYAQATFATTALTSPVTVEVGAGGAGGARITTQGDYLGVVGTSGASTTFGSYLTCNGGGVGTSVAFGGAGGTASVTGGTSVTTETGGAGAASNAGENNTAGNTDLAGAGGGSAGGGGASPSAWGPYNGGSSSTGAAGVAGTIVTANSVSNPPPIYGNPGTAGGAATGIAGGGGGGGGGACTYIYIGVGYNGSVTAGAGGAGGGYGSGGGGGGQAASEIDGGFPSATDTTGAGGDGGDGVLQATVYWLHTQAPQYLVYRNGVLIGTTGVGVTSFDDLSPLAGANTYTVYASYDGVTQMSAASNPVTVTLSSGNVYVSGKFSPANAFAPIMLINLKGVKPKFYSPVINPNMRSRR